MPRTKLVVAFRAFSVAVPRNWNSLPADVTSAESLPVFPQETKDICLAR